MTNQHDFSPKAVQTLADNLPVSAEDLAGDAALGGKLGVQDVAIPYLYVLQTMSPQVNPDSAKFIEGARAGMLYMTALERVFDGRDDGLTVVLCHYERLIVEWRQREAGGGFVGWHEPDSEIINKAKPNEKGLLVLPNGNVLTETAYHYVLVNVGDRWSQAIMPLKSTGLKVSRKVNYELATTYVPGTKDPAPRFLYEWTLKTVKEQRDQYTWSNVSLRKNGMTSREVYVMARAFAAMAAKGTLKRATAEETAEAVVTPQSRNGGKDDADIPF